jgi:hypothetical protein
VAACTAKILIVKIVLLGILAFVMERIIKKLGYRSGSG